jgi:hypothetical protein
LKVDGNLHHGGGTFDYGDWAVWLWYIYNLLNMSYDEHNVRPIK